MHALFNVLLCFPPPFPTIGAPMQAEHLCAWLQLVAGQRPSFKNNDEPFLLDPTTISRCFCRH